VVVEGMGFHLHDRAKGFLLDAKMPNALAPHKRPYHTIIPALMEKGNLAIGFGIMGGFNQPLAHAQFVSNVADRGMNIQAALEAPRFTKRVAKGCEMMIESRAGMDAIQKLSAKGHIVDVRAEYSDRMGRGNAVMLDTSTGTKYGASDPRADGAAIPEPIH